MRKTFFQIIIFLTGSISAILVLIALAQTPDRNVVLPKLFSIDDTTIPHRDSIVYYGSFTSISDMAVDSMWFSSPTFINNCIASFDSMGINTVSNRRALRKIITDSVFDAHCDTNFSDLDTLLKYAVLASQYNNYANCSAENSVLYSAASSFWFKKVLDTLQSVDAADPNMISNSKFLFIANLCEVYDFHAPYNVTNIEKAINYLVEGRIGYVVASSVDLTTMGQKIFIVFAMLIILIGLISGIINLIKIIKNTRYDKKTS